MTSRYILLLEIIFNAFLSLVDLNQERKKNVKKLRFPKRYVVRKEKFACMNVIGEGGRGRVRNYCVI